MTDASLIEFLAQRGLVFIEGTPPKTEDGTLLVWNGGCNALVARWNGGDLITWDDLTPLMESNIVCWMRLPHPSIWPMTKPPAALIAERDLYSAKTDVLTTFEGDPAMTGSLNRKTLLPCPFCGADDVIAIAKLNYTEAACFQCGAVAHADTWNKRVPTVGMPKMNELTRLLDIKALEKATVAYYNSVRPADIDDALTLKFCKSFLCNYHAAIAAKKLWPHRSADEQMVSGAREFRAAVSEIEGEST